MSLTRQKFKIRKPRLLGAILLLMAVISVLLLNNSVVDNTTSILGLLIIWTSAIPGLVFISGNDDAAAPFFPVVGLFYAIFFGLPVFTIPLAFEMGEKINAYGVVLVDEIRPAVLILVWAGIALMILFFYGSKYCTFKNLQQLRLPTIAYFKHLNFVYWTLFTVHLIYRLVPALHAVPSIGQFLEPAGLIGMGGLYIQWRRNRLTRYEKFILAFVFIPLEIYVRIRFFHLAQILLLIIFVVFILWREKQFKLIIGFTVIGIFLVTFYAASVQVRTVKTNPLDKMIMSAIIYAKIVLGGEEKIYLKDGKHSFGTEGRFGTIVRRTGHIWIFHRVYELSPDVVPYWHGETYRPLLTSIIPRVLYAGKPIENSGFKFGHRYGILKIESSGTSLNIPWIIEMLANFGVIGVILGMSLVGIFLAFLEQVFNARKMSDTEFMFGLTMIITLVYPESNLSLMVGSMLLLFISLFFYFYLASRISNLLMKTA